MGVIFTPKINIKKRTIEEKGWFNKAGIIISNEGHSLTTCLKHSTASASLSWRAVPCIFSLASNIGGGSVVEGGVNMTACANALTTDCSAKPTRNLPCKPRIIYLISSPRAATRSLFITPVLRSCDFAPYNIYYFN